MTRRGEKRTLVVVCGLKRISFSMCISTYIRCYVVMHSGLFWTKNENFWIKKFWMAVVTFKCYFWKCKKIKNWLKSVMMIQKSLPKRSQNHRAIFERVKIQKCMSTSQYLFFAPFFIPKVSQCPSWWYLWVPIKMWRRWNGAHTHKEIWLCMFTVCLCRVIL